MIGRMHFPESTTASSAFDTDSDGLPDLGQVGEESWVIPGSSPDTTW
jgi:hypothetical protein